jgi:hypothetical protein
MEKSPLMFFIYAPILAHSFLKCYQNLVKFEKNINILRFYFQKRLTEGCALRYNLIKDEKNARAIASGAVAKGGGQDGCGRVGQSAWDLRASAIGKKLDAGNARPCVF